MESKELFPIENKYPVEKNLRDIANKYSRYWYLILFGAVAGLVCAYLYLEYYAVPEYYVQSTLMIKDDKTGQELSSADAFSDLGLFKSVKNIDNEVEVLKSKSLMHRVVTDLDLFINYYVEGKIRNKELYGHELPIRLLIKEIDSTSIDKTFSIQVKEGNSFDLIDHTGVHKFYHFGQEVHMPYGIFTIVAISPTTSITDRILVKFNNIRNVADYYSSAISVEPASRNASVVNIGITDPIPERAISIVNKLMNTYNSESVEDKGTIAKNTLKFLDDRLKFLTTELSGVEKGVEKFKIINGLTDINTQASIYTEQASDYNRQLSEWAIQIDVLESIETYLKKTSGQYGMVPSTLGIKDATLLALINKFNDLQLERSQMLRTTLPSNPIVQNINDQLSNLRNNILENLRNIKKGLQITSNNLKYSSRQFQSKISRVPAMERELIEINRQQAIKQNIYVYLLQKREETALSLAATDSAARVIDPAMTNNIPVRPNKQVIYLMAFLLGISLPVAGIYLQSVLNNKVRVQQDVASILPIPIVGEIAHNSKSSKDIVVVTHDNRSPIAEMFRLVRANLQFAAVGKEKLAIMVTSSMSGEGKTFFSTNLGASLAIAGRRVALIDLDLRNPKIEKELRIPAGLGVTSFLSSADVSIDEIIRPSGIDPNLFIISSGPIPINPTELILSAKFSHLIHELKEQFDYIIIDTPPIGQVSDAFALSPLIDFTMYVIRYNYTLKAQLEIAKDLHKENKVKKILLVLNDAKESNGGKYGYGYGYGYPKKTTRKDKAF